MHINGDAVSGVFTLSVCACVCVTRPNFTVVHVTC